MIYLFTGSNGSGKTLNAIKFISEKLDKEKSRPVFYFESENQSLQIDEIGKLTWTKLDKEQVTNWFDLPDDSIIMVDEFRHVWPYRDAKRQISESVDRLSEHRSRGFDFVLTAQKPTAQFDPAIQGFIEEHRHLVGIRGMKASKHYVFEAFCSSPQSPPQLADFHIETHKFDKKYFGTYKSAETHTHVDRLPYGKLAGLACLPIIVIALGVYLVGIVKDKTQPVDLAEEVSTITDLATLTSRDSGSQQAPTDALEYLQDSIPIIEGMYQTAALYEHLAEINSYPKPQCIIIHPYTAVSRCMCWSQQGTPMNLSRNLCESYAHGDVFDHTRPDPEPNYDFLPGANDSVASVGAVRQAGPASE